MLANNSELFQLDNMHHFFARQGTSGAVKPDFPLALLHKARSGFPGTAEVMLTRSITMLVQPRLEQSNVIACSTAEVPWKPLNDTSLTFTAPACNISVPR